MNLSNGIKKLASAVKVLVVESKPQLPEWMQPNARTPRWADDKKRTMENAASGASGGTTLLTSGDMRSRAKFGIPLGYQDSTGFHHGPVPASKAQNPDIE